jgi:CRP-like cAMP-binding protein
MDAAGRLDAGALARLRFFESLGCDVLEQLVHETRVFSLRAGDYLFRRGEPARELFVVWAGRLRVLVEGEEGQRVVREVGPGGALGELALLTGSARSASVQAVRDSELLVLDAAAF